MVASQAHRRGKQWRARGPELLCSFVMLLLAANLAAAQVPVVPTSAPGSLIDADDYIRADRLGITFVGFIDNNMQAERYRNALILGSGWNRWPLYWDRVETQPNLFDWTAYDALVSADIHHRLNTNAILLGRPAFRQDGTSIANLFAPIFADGSDSAGTGDAINPDNYWAQFVHHAVLRYKPGGVLAQLRGFDAR